MSRGISGDRQPGAAEIPLRQRLDLWLLYARMARTRPLAAKLAKSGHVRIDGRRVRDPGKGVKIGDVLTISLERDARVLRIVALDERRGPYEQARLLYEELTQ